MAKFTIPNNSLGQSVAKSVVFSVTRTGLSVLKEKIVKGEAVEQDDSKGESMLGTKVYDNIVFEGGKYAPLDGGQDVDFAGGKGSEGFRIDHVLMSVRQSKNIVTTALNGKDGTDKEFMSNGDYLINITGSISGQNNNGSMVSIGDRYPESDMFALVRILTTPKELKLQSELLRYLGVDYIVITDFGFHQVSGIRNMQNFTITALSHIPLKTI